jgi:Trk K+ transport system NAD-binding subunit
VFAPSTTRACRQEAQSPGSTLAESTGDILGAVAGATVVCGLERLGLRVARALIALGEEVTIVAASPPPALLREATGAGARFLEGGTREVAQLAGTGIASARCLVLTESADLGNMHAALAAREVNPRLRVVMRMFSTELAERAARLLPNSRVLSASREAAPYFAAAALGMDAVPTRHVWGRHLVTHLDGGDEQLADLGDGWFLAPIEPPRLPRRRRSRRLTGFRRAVAAFFDVRLGVTAAAIGTLVAVTVSVFHAALHLSWVDAVYFTVTTASTTGYGDFNLHNAASWLKLYGSAFMLASAVSLALLYALAADAVIGARILEALGVPRGHMRGHVVVVGLGNTGYRVVQHLLDAGVEVAAAEVSDRNRFVAVARRHGVPVLVSDGRYRDSLRSLSVEGARAVVAATDDDLANLEAALTARELNPNARVVARLFDQDLAERAQQQLGLDACHSVSALATPAFAAASLGDGVLSTVEHGAQVWLVAELRVEPGSHADGMSVAALEEAGELRVLAVRDGGDERWRPAHPEKLAAGHDVLVAGTRERWEQTLALATT